METLNTIYGTDIWILSEGKLLIQKRSSQRSRYANMWAMTGGQIKPGETSFDAIIRECKEELGIDIVLEELIPIEYHTLNGLDLTTFLIKKDVPLESITLQEEEVSDIKYASVEEIDELATSRQFIPYRWEFVRDILISEIKNDKEDNVFLDELRKILIDK